MSKITNRILLAATAALVGAGPAHAATTGSITLSGTVSAATAIVVTGVTGYNSLDLSTTATDLSVADVREINNTANGYTVTMASSNAGQLKNGSQGAVTYTAKYNGSAVTLSSTPVSVTTAPASSSVVNTVKNLKVSYAGSTSQSLMVGNYTDTLTFTISAN